jgi:hypothetical protein
MLVASMLVTSMLVVSMLMLIVLVSVMVAFMAMWVLLTSWLLVINNFFGRINYVACNQWIKTIKEPSHGRGGRLITNQLFGDNEAIRLEQLLGILGSLVGPNVSLNTQPSCPPSIIYLVNGKAVMERLGKDDNVKQLGIGKLVKFRLQKGDRTLDETSAQLLGLGDDGFVSIKADDSDLGAIV